jgi:hypothetical protein
MSDWWRLWLLERKVSMRLAIKAIEREMTGPSTSRHLPDVVAVLQREVESIDDLLADVPTRWGLHVVESDEEARETFLQTMLSEHS